MKKFFRRLFRRCPECGGKRRKELQRYEPCDSCWVRGIQQEQENRVNFDDNMEVLSYEDLK